MRCKMDEDLSAALSLQYDKDLFIDLATKTNKKLKAARKMKFENAVESLQDNDTRIKLYKIWKLMTQQLHAAAEAGLIKTVVKFDSTEDKNLVMAYIDLCLEQRKGNYIWYEEVEERHSLLISWKYNATWEK